MTKKNETEAPAVPLRRVNLSDLKLDVENTRRHGKQNLQAIMASLIEFGQVLPLVVERGTMRVLGGNGTLRAMRALKWIECDIREVDEHDVRAGALAVALNRTAELAEWDDERLERALRAQASTFDLEALGWDDSELLRLLAPKLDLPDIVADDDESDGGKGDGLRYRIIIECAGEGEQAELLERLEGEGLSCQPLIS